MAGMAQSVGQVLIECTRPEHRPDNLRRRERWPASPSGQDIEGSDSKLAAGALAGPKSLPIHTTKHAKNGNAGRSLRFDLV